MTSAHTSELDACLGSRFVYARCNLCWFQIEGVLGLLHASDMCVDSSNTGDI